MARRARLSTPRRQDENEEEVESSINTARRRTRPVSNVASLSPSPIASFSSDKENRATTTETGRANHRKSRAMPSPKLSTPTSAEPATPRASKRRKLSECDVPNASQIAYQKELKAIENKARYDPEQNMDERREIRKELRDLSRELNGRSYPGFGLGMAGS